MNSKDIITQIGLMSYGRVRQDEEERRLNLQFLNLANIDLWSTMINAQEQYRILEILQSEADNDDYSYRKENGKLYLIIKPVNHSIYKIKGVFDSGNRLEKASFDNILDPKSGEYSIIDEEHIFYDSGNDLKVIYVPNPPLIEDNINELTHYPHVYHSALIEGALYYSYMSTFGFTDKIQIQLAVWENLKKSIIYHNVG